MDRGTTPRRRANSHYRRFFERGITINGVLARKSERPRNEGRTPAYSEEHTQASTAMRV